MTDLIHTLHQSDVLSSQHELGIHATGTIRLPEMRNIPMTPMLQQIIDHPAFQRLRQIRQLGPTHLVYPGAVHTRFEHSLGVYGCMIWFLKSLLQREVVRLSLTQEDLLSILAAALLHDIGHYPFAHSLEALHHKGRDTPKHEAIGNDIIMGRYPELAGARTIASILEQTWGVQPERVMALCTGDLGEASKPVDRFLRSLLSGSIDADKMDYLERDSHHMGVPYGRHYDRQRLLASLTINDEHNALAIDAKGKVSAEMFIFSRYTMFSEAYWHHTVRAASAMVENALSAFYSRSGPRPQSLVPTLLKLDDDRFMSWLCDQTPTSSATRYLLEGMIGYQRRLFKRVMTLSRVYVEEDKQRAYHMIYHMDAPAMYDLTDRLRVLLSKELNQPLHPASLIIDTPPRDKDRLETIDVVYANSSGQTHYPLHQLSRIVAGVQNDFMTVVKKIRIFAHPDLAHQIKTHPHIEPLIMEEILRSPQPHDQ